MEDWHRRLFIGQFWGGLLFGVSLGMVIGAEIGKKGSIIIPLILAIAGMGMAMAAAKKPPGST